MDAATYRDDRSVCDTPLSGEPFARTELFFGLSKSDGSTISEFQFRRFLRDTVTPLFPDGLTVLSGLGQFKDSSGRIIREGARLVILLYPLDAAGASENIDAIREAYKEEFEQQSVLRTDSIDCVSSSRAWRSSSAGGSGHICSLLASMRVRTDFD
ncbi:MAG: DUF3574 domain-containing protein [Acidimicrobiia bacterium]